MGRSHAVSGAAAGMGIADLAGYHTIPQALILAVTTAGFALLPDLDCGSATASRLLGPITGTLSRLLRFMSRHLYRWTKGPRDEDWEGTHRHMTHTILFAVLLGAGTLGGEHAWGQWATAGTAGLGTLLAVAAIGDWVLVPAAGGIVWLVASGEWGHALTGAGWGMALSVTVGCIVHDLGDSLTLMGCPFLFPIMIAGETWFEVRPPRHFRFKTGAGFESRVMFPALCVTVVLLVPGVWAALLHAVDSTS